MSDEFSDNLRNVLAAMPSFGDEELWQAARIRVSDEDSDETEWLHFKRQREGLSQEETQRLAGLMFRHDFVMMVRAQAMALLHQRGLDVSVLLNAS